MYTFRPFYLVSNWPTSKYFVDPFFSTLCKFLLEREREKSVKKHFYSASRATKLMKKMHIVATTDRKNKYSR